MAVHGFGVSAVNTRLVLDDCFPDCGQCGAGKLKGKQGLGDM